MKLLQQINEQEVLREATEVSLEAHAAEVLAEEASTEWSVGQSSADLFEELGI